MVETQHVDVLVLGSGEGGKYVAWTMAKAGLRTVVVERELIGGSCPNVACLPSKNVIHSAKVAQLGERGPEFGLRLDRADVDMAGVLKRKRRMVEELVNIHLSRYRESGAELVLGEGRFVEPKTIEVALSEGGVRRLSSDRVFLNLGTRASIPRLPGLQEVNVLTHVEALDLDRRPEHLIVLGGGFVGLELSQAMRRFGARVTIVERAAQLAPREDQDVADELLQLFGDEGIAVLLETTATGAEGGHSGGVRLHVHGPNGEQTIDGSDILIAAGRTPTRAGSISRKSALRWTSTVTSRSTSDWRRLPPTRGRSGTAQVLRSSPIDRSTIPDRARQPPLRLCTHNTRSTDPVLRVHRPISGPCRPQRARSPSHGDPLPPPIAAVLRTRTFSETRGFLKAVVDIESDRILGFTALGPEAGELMSVVQVAMLGGMPFTDSATRS